MKAGFIGCGKMGSALIQGVLAAKICEPKDVQVYDSAVEAAEILGTESGIRVAAGNRELVANSDVILLCVKPEDALHALAEAGRELEGKLLISIAAGITIASLQEAAGAGCRVVRVMPNTAALVQKGATAYAAGAGVSGKDIAVVEQIFTSVGRAFEVNEALLDAVTGLSGSGPAYVYLFVEALSDGGVQMGLPRDLALKLAVQTVAGAAEMLTETMMHPAVLREMVTSPAGTTIAGLAEMERGRLRSTVMDAVKAATLRARELGGGDEGA
ncbi:MAG: pyrroline-5-carboxylate reductase [Chthoniobacterales bacterium]|nr:pyrroline-5-carboxylate reductase [Chthoniobacterales bacterium]